MYIRAHIYIYKYKCLYVCICIYMHISVYTYMNIQIYTHTYVLCLYVHISYTKLAELQSPKKKPSKKIVPESLSFKARTMPEGSYHLPFSEGTLFWA